MTANEPQFRLHLRNQALDQDACGHNCWRTDNRVLPVPAAQLAIIVCDMWDRHWSQGAQDRVGLMVSRMNLVLQTARAKGAHIVHAPSDTMAAYAGTPARERILALPRVAVPEAVEHADPPLPIDDSDGGSDTREPSWYVAWTRQQEAIEIDQARDVISDDGAEIYSYLRTQGIGQVLIMGVHTNMCVLERSFGIKNMVRWGVPIALVRDLTDAMYNPALRPYVSHGEGTRLVIEFIEKFWCPTVDSADLF